MKHFGLLCIFLILIHFSTQLTQFVNCPENMKTYDCNCCIVTCVSEGTDIKMQALGCPLSVCGSGTQIGYHHEDKTKDYPDCCGHPICKE